MSIDALPYTLLLLLAQFTAGVAALVFYVQLRGTFEGAYLRICSWLTIFGAALTTLTAMMLNETGAIDGYALDSGLMDLVRALSMALLLLSLAYAYFIRREDEDPFLPHALGATTTTGGVLLLVVLAMLVREPTWGFAGPLLTLLAGALVLGTVTMAMIWGHWYLVNPKLEEGPLNELSLISFGTLVVELLVTALNAIIPVGSHVNSTALLAISLPENPAFWLRIGIGILFPALLAYMAFRSSRERSMMSATGLLYIAVGAVLAGEAVGRGLLFVTGAAV